LIYLEHCQLTYVLILTDGIFR